MFSLRTKIFESRRLIVRELRKIALEANVTKFRQYDLFMKSGAASCSNSPRELLIDEEFFFNGRQSNRVFISFRVDRKKYKETNEPNESTLFRNASVAVQSLFHGSSAISFYYPSTFSFTAVLGQMETTSFLRELSWIFYRNNELAVPSRGDLFHFNRDKVSPDV